MSKKIENILNLLQELNADELMQIIPQVSIIYAGKSNSEQFNSNKITTETLQATINAGTSSAQIDPLKSPSAPTIAPPALSDPTIKSKGRDPRQRANRNFQPVPAASQLEMVPTKSLEHLKQELKNYNVKVVEQILELHPRPEYAQFLYGAHHLPIEYRAKKLVAHQIAIDTVGNTNTTEDQLEFDICETQNLLTLINDKAWTGYFIKDDGHGYSMAFSYWKKGRRPAGWSEAEVGPLTSGSLPENVQRVNEQKFVELLISGRCLIPQGGKGYGFKDRNLFGLLIDHKINKIANPQSFLKLFSNHKPGNLWNRLETINDEARELHFEKVEVATSFRDMRSDSAHRKLPDPYMQEGAPKKDLHLPEVHERSVRLQVLKSHHAADNNLTKEDYFKHYMEGLHRTQKDNKFAFASRANLFDEITEEFLFYHAGLSTGMVDFPTKQFASDFFVALKHTGAEVCFELQDHFVSIFVEDIKLFTTILPKIFGRVEELTRRALRSYFRALYNCQVLEDDLPRISPAFCYHDYNLMRTNSLATNEYFMRQEFIEHFERTGESITLTQYLTNLDFAYLGARNGVDYFIWRRGSPNEITVSCVADLKIFDVDAVIQVHNEANSDAEIGDESAPNIIHLSKKQITDLIVGQFIRELDEENCKYLFPDLFHPDEFAYQESWLEGPH